MSFLYYFSKFPSMQNQSYSNIYNLKKEISSSPLSPFSSMCSYVSREPYRFAGIPSTLRLI